MFLKIVAVESPEKIELTFDLESTQKIRGKLFQPQEKYRFPHNVDDPKPISGEIISAIHHSRTRSNQEITETLKHGPNTAKAFARAADGVGSFQDVPFAQTALTGNTLFDHRLSNIASTPTVMSALNMVIRFEAASAPNKNEYIAPAYDIHKPIQFPKAIDVDKNGRTGQKNAPGYIFGNIFNITGVRTILEHIDPQIMVGGMESSSIFNTTLLMAGAMLSGTDLSQADIASIEVALENGVFGSLTGGQGVYGLLTGGAHQHIWTSSILNPYGETMGYGSFSIPLLTGKKLQDFSQHTLLLQTGKRYENGVATDPRTGMLTTNIWSEMLKYDSTARELHLRQPYLASQYTTALINSDYKTARFMIYEQVLIRNALIKRWLELVLAFTNKRKFNELSPNDKYLSKKYYAMAFLKEGNKNYEAYQLVRDLYKKHGERMVNISLYSLGADNLINSAWENGIAVMPTGAGGWGANQFAISEHPLEYLVKFAHRYGADGLTEIDPTEANNIINGTGTLKGFSYLETSSSPLVINGFRGCKEPEGPVDVEYDQENGEFTKL